MDDTIVEHIKRNEGLRLDVYKDTRGFLTVGYGHKIVDSDHLFLGDRISNEMADKLFLHDFYWILSGVKQLVKDFDSLPKPIQIVLCDIAYNNGIRGLSLFKRLLQSVNNRDYIGVANEIVDSDNYRSKDLHSRYEKLNQLARSVKC